MYLGNPPLSGRENLSCRIDVAQATPKRNVVTVARRFPMPDHGRKTCPGFVSADLQGMGSPVVGWKSCGLNATPLSPELETASSKDKCPKVNRRCQRSVARRYYQWIEPLLVGLLLCY